jgi:hypothetical protein
MNHPIFATQAEDFLATTLCLWRLTHLIGVEEGPFRLIARLRGRAGDGFFGGLLDCFYCLSVWFAIPLALLTGNCWTQRLLLGPALSGAACLLQQGTTRIDLPGVFEEAKE